MESSFLINIELAIPTTHHLAFPFEQPALPKKAVFFISSLKNRKLAMTTRTVTNFTLYNI